MAGIDYSLPGQFKGIQLESPMNAMARGMQLRNLQESSQLNALKAQEYQQQVQERNALAQLMGSGIKYGSDEFFNRLATVAPSFYEKIATGLEKRNAAEAQRQTALSTQQQREAATEEQRRKTRLANREFGLRKIAGAPDYGQAVSMIERSVRAGEIDREEADDMLSRLTPDADMSQFRTQTLTNMLAPEKVFEEQRAAEKATFDIDKLKADKAERKLKLFQSVVPNVNTIDGVSQLVSAMYQDPDLGPVLSQVRPYEEAINANQDAFNQDPENWKLTSSGVNPKDVIEMARNRVKDVREAERADRKEAREKARLENEASRLALEDARIQEQTRHANAMESIGRAGADRAQLQLEETTRHNKEMERLRRAEINKPTAGENPNKVAHTSTDDQGNVTFYNAFGQKIRTETNAGKKSPNLIKAEQAEKNLSRDIERTSKELAEITADGGLIDQSTGSYIGKAVDIGARVFGQATPGDIASAKLAPIADMVLKMVPRFEGPQSDKDTLSYKQAAGQLNDSTLPAEIRKEAGRTILRLMKERKDQFVGEGMDTSSSQRKAPPLPSGFVSDKK